VKPPRLILKTAYEFVDDMRAALRDALKDLPPGERSPKRIPCLTDMVIKETDDPDLVRRHLGLLKEIGVNGMFDTTASLTGSRLIDEAGFPFLAHWGVSTFPFNYADLEANRKVYETYALNAMDSHARSFGRDRVTNLHGDDELWSGYFEPFVALGDKVKPLVVSYLKRQRVPPAELGVETLDELNILPPGAQPPYAAVLKRESPALFYWLNRARMDYLGEQCRRTGEAADRYYPGLTIDSPNWPALAILNGGYEKQGWDLWLVHRKGGLRGTSGEPTAGGNFWLQGVFSFYADSMRSHVRNSPPMGAFVTTIRGSYPRFLNHFAVYELLARGISDIHWYSYGGMWGNENYATEIVRDLLQEVAIIHHEAALFENHLLDTRPEQAKVAILWTPAQEIWEPALHQEMVALYYVLLHANYAVDIVSGYDVADGCLGKYRVLYMPFSYVERETWDRVRVWVKAGGRLVLDGGTLRDEYTRPIPLGEWMPGYAAVQETREENIGGPTGVSALPLLDTAGTIEGDTNTRLPVVFSKAVLSVPSKGRAILAYGNGAPAAAETRVGRGRVTALGFCAGFAYLYDQQSREHPSAAVITAWHDFSVALRAIVTAPVREAGIDPVCGIRDDLVVARRRVGKGGKQCIVLFDYHFGNKPETPVFPEWENIGPRTVEVEIGRADTVKSVRGEILRREGPRVWVTFKGVDMLLVN